MLYRAPDRTNTKPRERAKLAVQGIGKRCKTGDEYGLIFDVLELTYKTKVMFVYEILLDSWRITYLPTTSVILMEND